MKEILAKLEEELKHSFGSESSGHDIYHLKRTLNLALTLQKREGGDKLVVAISALLHDVHRIIQRENGKYCSPKDSLPKVREFFNKVALTDEQKEKILHCIEFHEEYGFAKGGKTVSDIETLILQDADNLDAMGAIGIARTFMYTGSYGKAMWIPELKYEREYDESNPDPSAIHHFYNKLLKLKNNMNTKTAKQMAQQRHKFMETFLQEFLDEWAGKK